MVNEGGSSLTTPDTSLSCNPSSVNLEGGSSFTILDTALSCNTSSVNLEGGTAYVHLDDYIKWNSPGVIPRVFPLVLDTQLLWLL